MRGILAMFFLPTLWIVCSSLNVCDPNNVCSYYEPSKYFFLGEKPPEENAPKISSFDVLSIDSKCKALASKIAKSGTEDIPIHQALIDELSKIKQQKKKSQADLTGCTCLAAVSLRTDLLNSKTQTVENVLTTLEYILECAKHAAKFTKKIAPDDGVDFRLSSSVLWSDAVAQLVNGIPRSHEHLLYPHVNEIMWVVRCNELNYNIGRTACRVSYDYKHLNNNAKLNKDFVKLCKEAAHHGENRWLKLASAGKFTQQEKNNLYGVSMESYRVIAEVLVTKKKIYEEAITMAFDLDYYTYTKHPVLEGDEQLCTNLCPLVPNVTALNDLVWPIIQQKYPQVFTKEFIQLLKTSHTDIYGPQIKGEPEIRRLNHISECLLRRGRDWTTISLFRKRTFSNFLIKYWSPHYPSCTKNRAWEVVYDFYTLDKFYWMKTHYVKIPDNEPSLLGHYNPICRLQQEAAQHEKTFLQIPHFQLAVAEMKGGIIDSPYGQNMPLLLSNCKFVTTKSQFFVADTEDPLSSQVYNSIPTTHYKFGLFLHSNNINVFHYLMDVLPYIFAYHYNLLGDTSDYLIKPPPLGPGPDETKIIYYMSESQYYILSLIPMLLNIPADCLLKFNQKSTRISFDHVYYIDSVVPKEMSEHMYEITSFRTKSPPAYVLKLMRQKVTQELAKLKHYDYLLETKGDEIGILYMRRGPKNHQRGTRNDHILIKHLNNTVIELSKQLSLPLKLIVFDDGREFNSSEITVWLFEKQLIVASKASIMIGIHGAGLSHVVWMKEGTSLIEIPTIENDKPGVAITDFSMIAANVGVNYYVPENLTIDVTEFPLVFNEENSQIISSTVECVVRKQFANEIGST